MPTAKVELLLAEITASFEKCLYQALHIWILIFFLEKTAQSNCQIQWGLLVNSSFQILPQILNRIKVQALNRPL